jgi:hypothetical protein
MLIRVRGYQNPRGTLPDERRDIQVSEQSDLAEIASQYFSRWASVRRIRIYAEDGSSLLLSVGRKAHEEHGEEP